MIIIVTSAFLFKENMTDFNSSESILVPSEQIDPIIMYLVVRESLNMSIGKTAAQVGHAVQVLLTNFFSKPNNLYFSTSNTFEDYLAKQEMFAKWLTTSYRKVVLKADEKEWTKLKVEFKDSMTLVVDAGLTELEPNTETVIGIMPMYKSKVPKLLKRLQVLK